MSISTLENMDSVRILRAMDDLSDRQIQAEISAKEDFQAACRKGDANALPSFAPMITDWRLAKLPHPVGDPAPKRMPTLAEVMAESLDYRDGPSMTEAMQLLLNAANGSPDVQTQAKGLIDRMATTWSKFNTNIEA